MWQTNYDSPVPRNLGGGLIFGRSPGIRSPCKLPNESSRALQIAGSDFRECKGQKSKIVWVQPRDKHIECSKQFK